MTSDEIDELAMRSYAADGAQTNPMDWGRAFRAGIAALQQRQAEQAAAEFEAWDHRYERSRLDCGPTAKALQMTVEKPQAAWQAATQAAEAREAARLAEFRRRLVEKLEAAKGWYEATGDNYDLALQNLSASLLMELDQIFAAGRPGG